MIEAGSRAKVARRPLERLLPRNGSWREPTIEFDFSTPIDRSRWFVCPTLTPLYYAPVYHELDVKYQRRYNQLTALSFSELISFFENSFAASVLAALARCRSGDIDTDLADCLERFVAEERRHTEWWRRLNELSEPELYRNSHRAVVRLSRAMEFLLCRLTNHPVVFPVVFWMMLALEERSLEISRRCMRLAEQQIEPRYLAIYRAHLTHEVRHVQIDCHLIERYYAMRSAYVRRFNAGLFRSAIRNFFLPPTRTAVRVVNRLVSEFAELKPLRSCMRQQLDDVGRDRDYHRMMYSRESTPITFALFDRFSEFHAIQNVLLSYKPQ
jgi:hypothetical protein